MVAMATSIDRKNYTYQKNMLWCFEKDIKTLNSSQNLEGIFGVTHQRIRGGIP